MRIIIRKAKASEAKKVGEFCKRVISKGWAPKGYPKEAVQIDIKSYSYPILKQKLKNSFDFVFIALDDKKIVGTAIGEVKGKSGIANLGFIGVDPEYRNKGIASKLLFNVEKFCKQKKCHKLFANVLPFDAKPTLMFYKRKGFVRQVIVKNHWWGLDWIMMTKWLK